MKKPITLILILLLGFSTLALTTPVASASPLSIKASRTLDKTVVKPGER